MIRYTPFVILSVELAGRGDMLNAQLTEFAARQLDNQFGEENVTRILGKYAGTAERSFVVFLDDDPGEAGYSYLVKLARRYGQESILHVDANYRAELVYVGTAEQPAERRVYIGKWQEVPLAFARESLPAYSEVNGKAYAAV